jgi:hypothetical protein
MIEFLKQPGIYECCLVLSGIIFYRIVSFVLKYKELYKLATKTAESCMSMINLFYLDMRTSLIIMRNQTLKSKAYSDEEKKIVINEYADAEASIDRWYKRSLEILEEGLPSDFRIVVSPKEKK